LDQPRRVLRRAWHSVKLGATDEALKRTLVIQLDVTAGIRIAGDDGMLATTRDRVDRRPMQCRMGRADLYVDLPHIGVADRRPVRAFGESVTFESLIRPMQWGNVGHWQRRVRDALEGRTVIEMAPGCRSTGLRHDAA